MIHNEKILLLWGVVLSFFLFSCSQEEQLKQSEPEETVYQKVGRLHNEGLDYTLNYITQHKNSVATRSGQSVSTKNLFSTIETAVQEFTEVSSETGQTKSCPFKSDSNFSKVKINDSRDSLNDDGKYYLDKFLALLYMDKDDECVLKSLSELVSEISNNNSIDKMTQESLLYTVEVGIASYKYWTKKSQEWYNTALNIYESPNTKSARWVQAEGTVKDEYLRPLSGVSILITETNCGTTTDGNGHYGLGLNPNDQVVISMVGYKSVTIDANVFCAGEITTILEPDNGFKNYIMGVIAADAVGACVSGLFDPRAVVSTALFESLGAAVGLLVNEIID